MGWFELQLCRGHLVKRVPEPAVKARLVALCKDRETSIWAYGLLFDLIPERGEKLLLRLVRELKAEPRKLYAFFGEPPSEHYELLIVWRQTLIAG